MDAFTNIKHIPLDKIFEAAYAFANDKSENKINLSLGACLNENKNLHSFNAVLEAEKRILEKFKEKPYLLNNGTKDFSILSQKLVFGENSIFMKEKRICTIQTIGGIGALYIIINFLKQFNFQTVYVTKYPYAQLYKMLKFYGMNVKDLNFFDDKLIDINYELFLNDLRSIEDKSCIFLQISSYNPCSVDIDEKYHDEIAEIVLKKNHLFVFDIPYQGFSNSDIDKDVSLIRIFQEKRIKFVVCYSFSKNMSLYGERAGALHFVCNNKSHRQLIYNNLKFWSRMSYSTPICHTNRIVCEILKCEKLKSCWLKELYELTDRIKNIRILFFDKLQIYQKKYNLNYDWNIYKKQRGIFSFVPLFSNIYEKLIEKHVYIVSDGRINISGLLKNDIDFVVDTICLCLSELKV